MAYKFLVVDDEKGIREVLTFHLAELYPNCVIDEASNGAEALNLTKYKKYDVIYTDFKMPVMDGAEFIKTVRLENGPNKETGVLIVTGKGDLATLALSELENTLILDKPINVNRLQANTKIFLSLNGL